MKVLLTNDDGWDAPGLESLVGVASKFAEVWVVAPLKQQSGISHQLTFEQVMDFSERGPRTFSLDGTPADCVRVGLTQLEQEFDWVLSGVNNGGNLGTDVYVSGTVAGAREAVLLGTRAIALSQHRRRYGDPFDWTASAMMTEKVLAEFLPQTLSGRVLLNVNLPDIPVAEARQVAMQEWPLDLNPLPLQYDKTESGFIYSGRYNDRPRKPDHDIARCFGGEIAFTHLSV